MQLVHSDRAQLEADLATVQGLIDDGIFNVDPLGSPGVPRMRTIDSDMHVHEAYQADFDEHEHEAPCEMGPWLWLQQQAWWPFRPQLTA